MGVRLLKIAVVYFVIGVGFGMYMSIKQDFSFRGVHAHLNLLGWASLALAGLIYHVFPSAGKSLLGKLHFWLHNLGLPIMMISLTLMIALENPSYEIGIIIGANATALGVLLFLINVFMNVKEQAVDQVNSSKNISA
jgi:cbb3-type cytochrome oxidase subunit 1